jgi:hypothetical protein
MQGDVMVACQAHNLKVAGSIPASTTSPLTESIREPHPSETELSAGSSAQDSQQLIINNVAPIKAMRWAHSPTVDGKVIVYDSRGVE